MREPALTFCGNKLKAVRKKAGFSRLTLSYKIQFSTQAIHKWEENKCSPDSDAVARLSAVFKKPMEWFFEKEDDAKG